MESKTVTKINMKIWTGYEVIGITAPPQNRAIGEARLFASLVSLGRASLTRRGAPWPRTRTCSTSRSTTTTPCIAANAPGTTHTDREIQAAANLLGRKGVVADERAAVAARRKREHDERIERVRASASESLRGGEVVILGGGKDAAGNGNAREGGGGGKRAREWDGCVARIDVANLSAGRHGIPNARRGVVDEEAARPGRAIPKLDAGNRWKTEARIAAGGTGGTAELERARRAAHALDGGATDARDGSTRQIRSSTTRPSHPDDDDDDDAPVVVLPEDLEFGEDGWSRGGDGALDGIRSGDLAVPRNAALERDQEAAQLAAMERSTRRLSIDARRRRRRRSLRRGSPRDAGSWRHSWRHSRRRAKGGARNRRGRRGGRGRVKSRDSSFGVVCRRRRRVVEAPEG